MKMKETFKRFRAMQKHTGGFTLVELIVVIAILAILAGVAIPAYSGYITKANEAADQQLLSAVNRAFTAACMQEGYNPYDLPANPKLEISPISVSMNNDADLAAAFNMFFSGNENSQFKVFTEATISYSEAQGMFIVGDGSEMKFSYGGGFIVLNQAALDALKNTTFYESMGMDGILDKVDQVTDFASLMAGSDVMEKVLFSDGFMEYAGSVMGISPSDPDFETKVQAKADELIAQMQQNDPDLGYNDAYDKLMANAAVLYAAKNATDENVMTKQDITDLLKTENATQTILDNLNGTNGAESDPAKALSQAALAYGMYTAYAHSTGDPDLIAKTDRPNDILNGLNDPAFRAWISDPANERDLDGYLASLSMVTDSANDMDAASSLMVNGFNDQALKDIFGDALGE